MKGIIAAPGMALAKAYVIYESNIIAEKQEISDVTDELKRFKAAVSECYAQLEQLIVEMEDSVDPQVVEILDFQLLMLEDTDFIGKIEEIVSEQRVNSEYAVREISYGHITYLENLEDNNYLRERAADVRDLEQRLISTLLGVSQEITEPDEPYVIIGTDIPPSRVAGLDRQKLKGIILEKGGITSHCVILSRSMGIPCLIETSGILTAAKSGEQILLDAMAGEVILKPDDEHVKKYNGYVITEAAEKDKLKIYINHESKTKDGAELKVYANITMKSEAEETVRSGGEGVGLFRTELLYMSQTDVPPTEDSQYKEYSETAASLDSRPLIIRTLDLGGDKQIEYMDIEQEKNPFLGYRAIRYCLDHPEIFKTQISAILRAASNGNVWMMFPMITNKEEIRRAKQMVAEVMSELRLSGKPFDSGIKIGIMIETPAAAFEAKRLADEVDFFSIGTNDLSQYLFAADRSNAKVAELNSHFQPALLRVIYAVITAARESGIEVDICGQAAEVEKLVPLWVAMGVDNLSVSIPQITAVRRVICNVFKSDCDRLLDSVLTLETANDVERVLNDFYCKLE